MYKVLVVDDERIIRDGITKIIPWEKYGFSLSGVAENGLEAWEIIQKAPPQIVITDIKMPGLDGLGLITRVHAAFPEIRFIVLSGFGEFELAKEAMRYGVKHYLLKPCNENRIVDALEELKQGLRNEEELNLNIRKNREQLEHVLPLVKEQFIRDFVAYRHYTREEYAYYCSLLAIDKVSFRMILSEPVGEYSISELFGLMKIFEEIFTGQCYLNTTLKNQLLSLVQTNDDEPLDRRLPEIQEEFSRKYHLEINLAYSDSFSFEQAPLVYQELSECLKYSLYLGAGSIITPRDLGDDRETLVHREFFIDYDELAVAVKSGDHASVQAQLLHFFQILRMRKYEINLWKTYATELFMVLIRHCRKEDFDNYLDKLMDLQKIGTSEEIQQYIINVGLEITRVNQEAIWNKHHKIIGTLLDYIQKNLSNEELSLKWLANEVVFMNEGYLSKLFLKEVGEKFSHYLMRLRMEKAKELIEKNGADRIYEIAQVVGLGNNPQYFSQLFKKYTGRTPSEYKKEK